MLLIGSQYDQHTNVFHLHTSRPDSFGAGFPCPRRNPVVTVSSASFERDVPLAPDAIASGFGDELATEAESAATVPLPSELAGTTVVLTDSTGVERPAQLVFVSAKQVNYLIPAGMATGLAAVRITSGDGDVSTGVVEIASVSPGLFTANTTGGGVAAGWA